MAYTWTDGELITAEKLNNTGGGGGVLVVNVNADSSTGNLVLDKTWVEIQEAVVSHGAIVHRNLLGHGDSYSPVSVSMISMELSNKYDVLVLDGRNLPFTTDSIDGYPTCEQGGQA